MKRWISIILLSIVIIGVTVWGYQEHQEKNAILIQAENNYQRSFHDLAYNIDLLHDTIGSTLAMNTHQQLSPQLAEIWRLTSMAHHDVGQLPLSLLPFNKTEEFLSKLGDFSYRTAVRDLDNEPLSDDELSALESLYEMAADIESELRHVQNMVLSDNLRWMDVQLALVNNDEPADNTIIDGFQTVEDKVEGFEEGKFNASLMGTSGKEDSDSYSFVQGNEITENEAREKIRQLFDLPDDTEITIAPSGDGAKIPLYSASFQNEDNSGFVDLTKQGGYPVTWMKYREVENPEKSLHEAREIAEEYLASLEYTPDMALLESNQYDNMGVFQFIPNADGVWIYPDAIQIKVALDNGEIVGLVLKDFLESHKERDIPEPAISEEEAKERVNPNLKIQDHHLAVIEDDIGEEKLVYVFLGTLNNDSYKIFIDAEDGSEVRVEKLKQAEMKY